MKLDVHVLRVFTDENEKHGNELAVVSDAAGLTADQGVALTNRLGFSESVFVDDPARAEIRIFTGTQEIALAGHPAVGTAWALGQAAGSVPVALRPRLAAELPAWSEDGLTWISGAVADAIEWDLVEVDSPAAVDEQPQAPRPPAPGRYMYWSWIDRRAGLVRARCFAPAWGVGEDEATGSAAIHLTDRLGRELTIRQGRGSVLRTKPAEVQGRVDLGGRVVSDGMRTIDL
jgi:predicted PhzF superfamily epimerase YddE/YHI9